MSLLVLGSTLIFPLTVSLLISDAGTDVSGAHRGHDSGAQYN